MMANDDESALLADELRKERAEFCRMNCAPGFAHDPRCELLASAADAITALHARVQELEAKWVELPTEG